MRVRGLKHSSGRNANGNWIVAPHAGAWIETGSPAIEVKRDSVAPHTGAWIETFMAKVVL